MNDATEVLGRTFQGLMAVFLFVHLVSAWRERIRKSGHRKTMHRIAEMQANPFLGRPLDPR